MQAGFYLLFYDLFKVKGDTMGAAKEEMLRDDHRRQVAIEIAIQAGNLSRCKYHEDAIFEGDNDIAKSYALANSKFTKGELKDTFDDRRQMTDTIKDVVEDNAFMDECPYCAKIRDKD